MWQITDCPGLAQSAPLLMKLSIGWQIPGCWHNRKQRRWTRIAYFFMMEQRYNHTSAPEMHHSIEKLCTVLVQFPLHWDLNKMTHISQTTLRAFWSMKNWLRFVPRVKSTISQYCFPCNLPWNCQKIIIWNKYDPDQWCHVTLWDYNGLITSTADALFHSASVYRLGSGLPLTITEWMHMYQTEWFTW